MQDLWLLFSCWIFFSTATNNAKRVCLFLTNRSEGRHNTSDLVYRNSEEESALEPVSSLSGHTFGTLISQIYKESMTRVLHNFKFQVYRAVTSEDEMKTCGRTRLNEESQPQSSEVLFFKRLS